MRKDRSSRSDDGSFVRDERSLSEVLGYVIVFGIILTSVTLLVVGGMSSLEDSRESEQIENAERAFDVVADNMAQIYERNAPSRSTEIDLGTAEIFYADNVSMTVTVNDGQEIHEHSYELRPIEMRVTSEESLVYEAGAVFRDRDNGAAMVDDPPFTIGSDRVHVPIVRTVAPGVESAGGTTILLRGKSTDRAVLEANEHNSYENVTIEITGTTRYEAWESYFEDQNAIESCTTDGTRMTVSCSTDDIGTVYVTLQEIELSLIL